MMSLEELIASSPLIMTEGAVVERLRREFKVELDPYVVHSGLIYKPDERLVLSGIYKQYIEIVKKRDLPMFIFTPTRRANPERLKLANLLDKDVNGDCARFLVEIRDEFGEYSNQIFIGGIMGCKGDAYKPQEALTSDEAELFHEFQAKALSNGE